jgi:hypothetical protein
MRRIWQLMFLVLTGRSRLVLDAGWLLLLLAAVGLALGLRLSSRRGRDTTSWPRLRRWLRSQPGRWVPRAVIAVGVLAVLVAVVAVLPPRFTAHRDFDKASEQLKAQNDVRATLTRARQARSVGDQGVFYGWSSVCLGVGDGAVLSLASGSLPDS